jgi:hypothetical protein
VLAALDGVRHFAPTVRPTASVTSDVDHSHQPPSSRLAGVRSPDTGKKGARAA